MLRAMDEGDRHTRRTSILVAARALFRQRDGGLPTVAEIAAAAGLAKGTVYLYFKTKEEIFANVLMEGWLGLLTQTQTLSFNQTKKPSQRVQVFIEATIRHVEEHPELLRLDALAAAVLEKNMTPEALSEYKRRFARGLLEAGSHLEVALSLEVGRGIQLLMRTYALTRGLWQTAEHSSASEAACVENLMYKQALPFLQDLSAALVEYWRGALL